MISRLLRKKLLAYGLGAGAASIAGHAHADIVYSGTVDFTGNNVFFDLQNMVPPSSTNDGLNDDFALEQSTLTAGTKAKIFNQNTNTGGGQYDSANATSYVLRLGAGTTIGGGGNFAGGPYFEDSYAPGGGSHWSIGDRGFVGLKLQLGSSTFYGWADVTTNNFDGTGAGAFTLHSYAFEDSGAPITAGAVPEPGTVALLIAGAAGIAALRRRKK